MLTLVKFEICKGAWTLDVSDFSKVEEETVFASFSSCFFVHQ